MLQVEEVTVRFGEVLALDRASLEVGDGEVVTVLGPSGSGKTTLLRVVAGLQRPDAGRVQLDGRDLAGVPPHRRGIGFVFQDHALFQHRDVWGNVAFGLRMRGDRPVAIARRVAELLELVGLAGYERRSVATLSGGEAQRVALVRALAPEPRVLLLDEPLGSLDRRLRDRLLEDLARLFAELRVTALYVTHDQAEAFALGDRVAVMRAGRVVQTGTPDELWARPADADIARFLGLRNVLDGRVVRPEAVRVRRVEGGAGGGAGEGGAGGAGGAGGTGGAGGGGSGDGTGGEGGAGGTGGVDGADGDRVGGGEGVVESAVRHGPTVRLVVRLDGGGTLEAAVASLDHPVPGDRVRVDVDRAGVVDLSQAVSDTAT